MRLKYLTIVFMFFCTSTLSCHLTVRVEPFAMQSQKGDKQWHGLNVDLATALLESANCRFEFVSVPWARALELIEVGEIDMMLDITKTNQRDKFLYFIGPQRLEKIVFASLPTTKTITNIAQIIALEQPVAIQRGAYYGKDFDELLMQNRHAKEHFIHVAGNQKKVELLIKNRISGFLEAQQNINFIKESYPELNNLITHPVIINEQSVFFALSRKSVSLEIYKHLEQEFDQLKSSGRLKKIFAQYNLPLDKK